MLTKRDIQTIEFSDDRLRAIINAAQSGAAPLQAVALLNCDSGEMLCCDCDSQSLAKLIRQWLVTAQGLFHPAISDIHLPEQPTQFVLRYRKDSLIGFNDPAHHEQHVFLATNNTLSDKHLESLRQSQEMPPKPVALGEHYFHIADNTIKIIGKLTTEGHAGMLYQRASQSVALTLALFGQQPLSLDFLALDTGDTLSEANFVTPRQQWLMQRLRFFPDYVLAIVGDSDAPLSVLRDAARAAIDSVIRQRVSDILKVGIETDTELASDDQAANTIIQALRKLDHDDLLQRLEIGGFADHSLGEPGDMLDGALVLRCKECIYYLPHRRWCDLPELPIPVEADWYCRLWRL